MAFKYKLQIFKEILAYSWPFWATTSSHPPPARIHMRVFSWHSWSSTGAVSALVIELHRWGEDENMTRRQNTQTPLFSCLHKYLPQVRNGYLCLLLWQVDRETSRQMGLTGFLYKLFKDSKGSELSIPVCGGFFSPIHQRAILQHRLGVL